MRTPLLLALLIACSGHRWPEQAPRAAMIDPRVLAVTPMHETAVADPVPVDKGEALLPPGAPLEGITLRSHLYDELLEALGEPSLFARRGSGLEAYRFVWWRAFDPKMVVRIVRKNGQYFVVVKSGLERGTGFEIRDDRAGIASVDSVKKLDALLATIGFSTMTSEATHGGRDGAWWLVEVLRDGDYHAVERWDGEDGLALVGAAMLRLAGARIEGPLY